MSDSPFKTVEVFCLHDGQTYTLATNNLEHDDVLHWWDEGPLVAYCGKDLTNDTEREGDNPDELICAGCYVQWCYGD